MKQVWTAIHFDSLPFKQTEFIVNWNPTKSNISLAIDNRPWY